MPKEAPPILPILRPNPEHNSAAAVRACSRVDCAEEQVRAGQNPGEREQGTAIQEVFWARLLV